MPDGGNVNYRDAFSDATGLANNCADIVTISQALHWMEPESTFGEVARILRPGSVIAASLLQVVSGAARDKGQG